MDPLAVLAYGAEQAPPLIGIGIRCDTIQVPNRLPLQLRPYHVPLPKLKILVEKHLFVFSLHDLLEPLRIFAQNINRNCPNPELLSCVKIFPKSSSPCLAFNSAADGRQTDGSCDKPNVT